MAKGKAWTLASGARFARDSRIATAAHLRDARIAREWQFARLSRAYQIHMDQFADREVATVMLLGGMGYRPPFPLTWHETSDMVVTHEAGLLVDADLYVLTPDMCDVVVAAAQTLTVDDLKLLDETDLPSSSGLVVLPHPLVIETVGGELADNRAFHWHSPIFLADDGSSGPADLSCVRVSVYHDTFGPIQPESFKQFARQAFEERTQLPPLTLDSIRCLPFHYQPDDGGENLENLRNSARKVDRHLRQTATAMGLEEETAEGEYTPGSRITDSDNTFTLRFLYAFWRLCEQRIADTEPAPVNHSTRLAAGRAGVSPEVRIVRLRRADKGQDATGDTRYWQHRWVVRMHKVRQWYPSEQTHKIIYRGPYIKGPADKPLIGGETVQALIR